MAVASSATTSPRAPKASSTAAMLRSATIRKPAQSTPRRGSFVVRQRTVSHSPTRAADPLSLPPFEPADLRRAPPPVLRELRSRRDRARVSDRQASARAQGASARGRTDLRSLSRGRRWPDQAQAAHVAFARRSGGGGVGDAAHLRDRAGGYFGAAAPGCRS